MPITKGEKIMAGRNGTGPSGQGSMTGRGLGNCSGNKNTSNSFGNGLGTGRGLRNRQGSGMGQGRGNNSGGSNINQEPAANKSRKDILSEEKELIEKQLKDIKR